MAWGWDMSTIRLKYGLPSLSSAAIYELGFTDHTIALGLTEILGIENNQRYEVIAKIKEKADDIRQFLINYPLYFEVILQQIINR
jgi:POLQ-like helicase